MQEVFGGRKGKREMLQINYNFKKYSKRNEVYRFLEEREWMNLKVKNIKYLGIKGY